MPVGEPKELPAHGNRHLLALTNPGDESSPSGVHSSGSVVNAQASRLLLLAPVNAAVVVCELEAASVRVAEVEALRRRRVVEWPSDLTPEAARALEYISEPWAIDVECDLIRVGSRAGRLRGKEGKQRLTEPERTVVSLEFLGASQLKVETPQTIWVRRTKGKVIDTEDAHPRAQSKP